MDANLVEPFLQVAVCFRVYRTTTYNIFCIKKNKNNNNLSACGSGIRRSIVQKTVGLDTSFGVVMHGSSCLAAGCQQHLVRAKRELPD